MSEFYELSLSQTMEGLASGKFTSEEITKSYLDRIESVDHHINSFVTVDIEGAMTQARDADRKRAGGDTGSLLGAPLGLKDLLATKNLRTTCSSKMLQDFVPPYDAHVVTKLKEAGAVIIGKTNMDEFAMGSSTESSYMGPTKNPWDLSKIPGGSSGGSAAAVAADLCAASLGSDTGGSIRQPASCCGVVGLKPTYGRVSRFGMVAFASSLDQIGPITKTVKDSALLMNVIAGHDPMDSTSAPELAEDYTKCLEKGVEGLSIGVPKEYFIEGADSEVTALVQNCIDTLTKEGAIIKEVSLPHTKYAVPTYYVLAPAEASSNLARYDGVRYGFRSSNDDNLESMYDNTRKEGFGPEVKRRIMLGTYALSAGYYDAYYLKAQKVRTLIRMDFLKAFEEVSALIAPTMPTTAFSVGEKSDNPLQMYLSDILTINVNLAGIPGISIPCGISSAGLPVGAQIITNFFEESMGLRVANTLESALGLTMLRPSI
tara:strand:- start:246306 stop:247766 length:1461 start_codon:yes stop_codon:yes gene_type:complete